MQNRMDMHELISIIIPVYNASDYIERCLDSIMNQTYNNFEVIIVDDGSTDDSGRKCDAFCEKDSRFCVYHIDNGGVSRARNYALKQVQGAWFCYLDVDDWLETDYLEILYRNAIENECDISGCCFERNSCYHMGERQAEARIQIMNSPEECIRNFICSGLSLNGMVWNKLYRTDRFCEITFDPSIKVNEDCLYTYEIMKRCQRACVTSQKLYHWYFRNDSACHSRPSQLDFSAANVFLLLYQQTEQLQDGEMQKILKRNYVNSVINMLFYVRYSWKDETVLEARHRIRAWKADVYPMLDRNQRIKYILVMKFGKIWNSIKRLRIS